MSFEIINPLDYPGWDDLLLTHGNSSFFHSSPWAKVLNETYGYEPIYFTRNDNGKLFSLIPVMEIKSFLTGKRGVSLPFTDICEPIIAPGPDEVGAWEALIDYGDSAGWKYLEIRGGEEFNRQKQPSTQYYEHILDLSGGTEEIYSRFRESTKRNIKKARKAGVEVEFTRSPDSMREFYQLNCLTRKMHGLPPQPYTFFKNIHEYIISKNNGLLAIARYGDKAIASSIYFHFGRKAIYKYGASDREFQSLRANNLVMWKAIEWYCRNGYSSFSFGRTDAEHEGLRQFKSGWGAEERKINYFRYDFLKNDFIGSASGVNGWHTDIFKKTPVSMLKMVGRLLYRHMG